MSNQNQQSAKSGKGLAELQKDFNLSKKKKYERKKIKSLLERILAASVLYDFQIMAEKNGRNFVKLKNVTIFELEIINYIIASELIKLVPRTQKEGPGYTNPSKLLNPAFYEVTPESIKKMMDNGIADPSVDIKFYPVGLTDKGYDFIHPVKAFLKDYKYWITTGTAVLALIVAFVALILKIK